MPSLRRNRTHTVQQYPRERREALLTDERRGDKLVQLTARAQSCAYRAPECVAVGGDIPSPRRSAVKRYVDILI